MLRRISLIGAGILMAAGLGVAVPSAATAKPADPGYLQTNIVSDQAGVAALTDPNLVNAWGMSRGANSPIWVSNAGTSTSTLYTGGNGTAPPSITPLVVSIPGGPPSGQVFNDTTAFLLPGTTTPARFIFAGLGGAITAWASGTAAMTAVPNVPNAGYTGLALAHSPFGPLLLGANFAGGTVDVYDATFKPLPVGLLFSDALLAKKGYAPFNVTELNGNVYVAYALRDPATGRDAPGKGHGFIDVFTSYGAFVKRLASGGVLNSPWGLAIAPASFGKFGSDLLVGNFGNGQIHAFDPATGKFVGTVQDSSGHAIVIDKLWGLLVGDVAAGGPNSVWFSAGPANETHGLVGILTAN